MLVIAMTSENQKVDLHPSWLKHLSGQFELPYMQQLQVFLAEQKRQGKIIYPEARHIFNAFNSAPLDQVKVVILGQDPYHGPNQAHGLCFSVQPGVAIPPSLKNIYKELERDLQLEIPAHGCLQASANQGVLLLNTCLTVEQGHAASHQGQGWEQFIDCAIELVNDECPAVVFFLWGSHAQKKRGLINESKHLVLTAPHPSPLSAYRGFIGCGHFSKANYHLIQNGLTPIDWLL